VLENWHKGVQHPIPSGVIRANFNNCLNSFEREKPTTMHELSVQTRSFTFQWTLISSVVLCLLMFAAVVGKRLTPSCSMTCKNYAEL